MNPASPGSRPPEIPASLRSLMAEIGPRWAEDVPRHVEQMIAGFSELLRSAPRDGVELQRDIAYGPHPRHRLDVFVPPGGGRLWPAVLFVHGGAFVDGHRNRTEEIYANVLYYFARHGAVGINIGYRLAGDARYPGATDDIAGAVEWVLQNAAQLGIDSTRVFLMGHSAGCAHVASYGFDKHRHPAVGGAPGLRGLVLVSGRVRADARPDNPNAGKVAAYYGTSDMAELDRLSPVTLVGPDSPPTFVAWAEYENPLIDVYCAELVYRLGQAKGRTPPLLWLRGHNHTSIIGHFNTAEDVLGRAILDFMEHAI